MASMRCLNDDTLGPTVHGCRDDFDFTQKFERIFFSAVPASVFILVAIARAFHLAHKPQLIPPAPFQFVKVVAVAVYVVTQLSLLVLVVNGHAAAIRGLSILGVALTLTASFLMIVLSFLEHVRSRRTSILLNSYLFLTLLLDVVQARTLWLAMDSEYQTTFTYMFTASVVIKLVVLLFEAQGKSGWISWDEKEHSPEETSGIYSLSFYYWLRRLFFRGYNGILLLDDLYGLDSAMSAENTASKLMKKLNEQKKDSSRPSLLKGLLKAFAWPLCLPVLPQLALVAFQYAQSFFLQALILFLDRPDHSSSKNFGYGLIAACALIYFGMALSTSYSCYYRERAVAMTRACLCAAIYKKTLEITAVSASDKASVTLMSTDVEFVQVGVRLLQTMWSSLIQVGVGFWLLYTKLGIVFVTPIVIISICSGILLWIMTLVKSLQSAWMQKIQDRVGFTVNAISNMKCFKMLGIQDHVADLVQDLRGEEIRSGTKFRLTIFAAVTLSYIPLSASPALTFALTFRELDASTLFLSLSFMTLLTTPLLHLFQGLPRCLAALASLRRIQVYLAKQPRTDFRLRNLPSVEGQLANDSKSLDAQETLGILRQPNAALVASCHDGALPLYLEAAFVIRKGSFGWGNSNMVLKDIDIAFPSGKLSMVIGPTASGKSTLCQVLLGEVPTACGWTATRFSDCPIGYCSQTPFLPDGTILETIVGYAQLDQRKYDATIRATMLDADVALLPSGHHTKIGSNGIILSGGQKQRVALARALYLGSKVLILDDVFSGLDAATETELFKRLFGSGGIIRDQRTTAIVCTHSVRHIPFADHIVVLGSGGAVVEQGSFHELTNNGKYVSGLNIMAHNSDDGQISDPGDSPMSLTTPQVAPVTGGLDQSRRTGDWSIYMYYIRQITPQSVVAFTFLCILTGTATNFATVWVSYWSENAFDKPRDFYTGIYVLIRAIELFAVLGTAIIGLTDMVSSSGSRLHKQTFTTVVKAPLSLFASTNTGTVTNLFSQDMTLIDGELPLSFLNTAVSLTVLIGNFFVAAIASPYLAISYPFLVGVLYMIQVFYLRTSRQLRLLDLEAKSPLYDHFIDTISGLSTIRAFGWTQYEIDTNNKLLNASQRPVYLLPMIQAWLQTTLTLLVGIVAICLTILATQLRASSSFTGASLLTLMGLVSVITSLMESYTRLETSIGAVNRLKTFSQNVKPEDDDDETMSVSEQWPDQGRLSLSALSASYSIGLSDADEKLNGRRSQPLALDNITLSIQPGEKIGVCGRTGSGKSSLILALLRFLEPSPNSQEIKVDEIPIRRVQRSVLRERFIVVPQDTVFLPGRSTLKLNLDPSGSASDEECMSVLGAVQLSNFIQECGGLHAQMNATSLSAGQQQLFGLGRAILRRLVRDKISASTGGILLLDEMNSKLDVNTERITQGLVRTYFRDYTVIMIAHRLDMVMNMCDRVLVLDKGALVEDGDPKILAETSGSWFAELWNKRT